ncbi:HNH endonuclease [Klebsiella phage Spivey]|uniref:HNH endonuclease n=1 Tax=Klebsiella phage Spivey TaxID=2562542 RepID=A0A4D5ZIQ8_9CAUD|nr:HNH endonuclease [Klebsiella phage Spivey]
MRKATSSQNSMNSRVRSDNEFGMKNIRPKGNSFQVRIGKQGKSYTKTLKTLEEAIKWRDSKLAELHGEFANNGEI